MRTIHRINLPVYTVATTIHPDAEFSPGAAPGDDREPVRLMSSTTRANESKLVLNETVRIAKRGSLSHPTEILVIELNSVSAHHAVNVESHAYFSDDAAKEGIELSEGRYESTWLGWVGQQESATYLAAAETLIRIFGIPVDLHRKRTDGYHWLDIIELARNSKISIKAKPRHIEDLLRSVRQISNAAAGVHSTASCALAVNIEWVVTRLGKDPLRKKGLRTVLEEALDVGRNVDWSIDPTSCEPVARAVEALAEAFPRSYTPDISPEMVVLTNRLIMAAKEQSLSPIDVSVAIDIFSHPTALSLPQHFVLQFQEYLVSQ